MQALADVHDTAMRVPSPGISGSADGWTVQLEPLPRSASVITPRLDEPTAAHACPAPHHTPLSVPLEAPAGCGMRWIDQRRPSQCSTNGRLVQGLLLRAQPVPNSTEPSVVHDIAEVHETSDKPGRTPPDGTGSRSCDHARPFQRPTSGSG